METKALKRIIFNGPGWKEAQRARSNSVLCNKNPGLFSKLFKTSEPLQLREPQEVIQTVRQSEDPNWPILVRAALDIYNSSGNLSFNDCLLYLNNPSMVQLIRALCRLREIELDAIRSVLNDYMESPS